jgi:hypothetical protein
MLQYSDEVGNRHYSTFHFLPTATAGARQFAHPVLEREMVERLARYDVMMKTLRTQDGDLVGEQQFTMDRPYNDLCKSRKEYRLLIDYCLLKPNGLQNINARRVVKIMAHPWHKKYKDLSDHFALEALLTFQ